MLEVQAPTMVLEVQAPKKVPELQAPTMVAPTNSAGGAGTDDTGTSSGSNGSYVGSDRW